MDGKSLRAALVVLIAALAGCASGPKYSEVKNSIPALDPEQGRIYFYRPSAFGAAIQPNILVNGAVVGEMLAQGFFFIDRFPGVYQVMARTESEANLTVKLEASQTQYVQGSISLGILVGRPVLTLVDQVTAMTEIADLSYTGSSMLSAGSGAPPGTGTADSAPRSSGTGAAPGTQLKDLEGLLPGGK